MKAGSNVSCGIIHAFAWKTHAVDDGFIVHQAEDARLGVARLRTRGDGPQLEVTETQCGQAADGNAVLVVTGGQSDRVLEGQAESLHRFLRRSEQRLQEPARGGHQPGQPDQVQGQAVGDFGVKFEKQGANEFIH